MPCPDCGEAGAGWVVHEWGDGAKTKECKNCGYYDWIPPEPEVRK